MYIRFSLKFLNNVERTVGDNADYQIIKLLWELSCSCMHFNVDKFWLQIHIALAYEIQKKLLSLFGTWSFCRHYVQNLLSKQFSEIWSIDHSFFSKFYTDQEYYQKYGSKMYRTWDIGNTMDWNIFRFSLRNEILYCVLSIQLQYLYNLLMFDYFWYFR